MSITPAEMTPLLQVYDMPEALAFYRDVLGFEIRGASPVVDAPEGRFSHWVSLALGSARIMLNTAYDVGERPTARVENRQRWHGDTCLYFEVPDVDAVFAELRRKISNLESPSNAPYGMRQLHLRDRDGYQLCFQTRLSA